MVRELDDRAAGAPCVAASSAHIVRDDVPQRNELLAQVVIGLGHDVIAREIHVKEVGPATARERSDVAIVGLGLSSEHALELIGEIVREAPCPVIALLHAKAGDDQQAKGILMARHLITADKAFELLRAHSQTHGRKLVDVDVDVDVAEAVVESHVLLAAMAVDHAESREPEVI